jgi:hypothetical protein|tara:strand:- start:222 stop:827 length:606 start_codon:yes stop_codon:yes gene_type:complete
MAVTRQDVRVSEAFRQFDQANAEDPNTDTVDGTDHPKELLYAQRMTATLEEFAPEASDEVRLAVRCQHIRRWTIPRETYPDGREGYRRWRSDLALFHADTAASIMGGIGYDQESIARVSLLLRKERLKSDPEVQLLEDVACLVFLTHYLSAFVEKHESTKVIDILRKTWRKMSDKGHTAALQLNWDTKTRPLVEAALSSSS